MRMPRGFVYRCVRGVTRLVGGGVDAVLAPLAPLLSAASRAPRAQCPHQRLNAALGDHLAASGNLLGISMELRVDGRPLRSASANAPRSYPNPAKR